MLKPVQRCTACGAGLSLDDMRGTSCPYCNVVYPHHAQAQQYAQVAGHMMNAMVQQQMQQQAAIQSQWGQAHGMPPQPPGHPMMPYGTDPNQLVQAHLRHAKRTMTIVLASTLGISVLVGAILLLAL